MTPTDNDSDFCDGLHVLLVEDESIIAMLTESMLMEMGCSDVVIAGSIEQAMMSIERELPDLAVLDVNVRGEMVLPVAHRLQAAGIPFAFATGYGRAEMLADFHDYPIVQKPFDLPDLENALRTALTQRKQP